MSKVLVTLVTYNRRNLLMNCLKSLLNQEEKVSGILIVDNASTDDTEFFLKKMRFLEEEVTHGNHLYISESDGVTEYYYRNSTNLGGAGGFAKAIELSKNLDYDYIWIMDDDVAPAPNCLSKLLSILKDEGVNAVIPNRNDDNYLDEPVVGLDLKSVSKYFTSRRKEKLNGPYRKMFYSVKDFTFEGPLIAMDTVRKVGIPNAEYFLLYDDSDYAQRVLKYTKILFVTDAHLYRQVPAPIEKKGNKRQPYTWKNYYRIRNNIIFDKTYGQGVGARIVSPYFMLLHLIVSTVVIGHPKNDFPLIFKAWYDGKKGKMGKQVDPNY